MSFGMTDAVAASVYSPSSSSLYVSNEFVDILKNFGLVLGILVIVLVGFLTLFSTVIIPQAAEQLETQTKRDFPDLWEDIAASNLQPGEELVQRPDIMQKLGTAVRQRLEANLEQAAQQQEQEEEEEVAKPTIMTTSSSSTTTSSNRVMDAEVVNKDEKE